MSTIIKKHKLLHQLIYDIKSNHIISLIGRLKRFQYLISSFKKPYTAEHYTFCKHYKWDRKLWKHEVTKYYVLEV